MMWTPYRIVLRLRSPMHIGCGTVGNLQRTRPYVTGRALWGALTARIARERAQKGQPADTTEQYQNVGRYIDNYLTFTYFYPATQGPNGQYEIHWPWRDGFEARFLTSYQSTALTGPSMSASQGTLHEVELICPNTTDTGEPVFLIGYFFVKDGCQIKWQNVLSQLQIVGERGYGWGAVGRVEETELVNNEALFDGSLQIDIKNTTKPSLKVPKKGYLLAHTVADDELRVVGKMEPLVGREWRSNERAK